jgi:hypothetical protein
MNAMQQLTVMQDPVADALDDMAALGLHWTRNRERGRMPHGIRQAMLLVAREALAHADAQERSTNQFMDNLCGPAAFARNNGAVLVCPEKDHECGDHAVGWCATCPKRSRA